MSNIPDGRLSNVIGAPFSEFVLTQLDVRAQRNSTGTGNNPLRTSDEILFLANKTAWVKLTSSVRIAPTQNQSISDFYKELGLEGYSNNPETLAKNWILQSGTSIGEGNAIKLRSGLGDNGSYGLGGIKELGYRPMPGLTNVQIETKGTLGSLREANISFKVMSMDQLNIIEALYFRLGYSMLLEWGHVQYFNNQNPSGNSKLGTFQTDNSGIDPFSDVRKEIIQQNIYKNVYQKSGNYDGMLGIVQNFVWSFNQEGGYDCTLKLIGLGSIIDSLRINLSYKLPAGLFRDYEEQQKTILQQLQLEKEREIERQRQKDAQAAEAAAATAAAADAAARNRGLPPVATNATGVYEFYKTDVGTQNADNLTNFLDFRAQITPAYQTSEGRSNTEYDYYYKANVNNDTDLVNRLNLYRTGLFLNNNVPGRTSWDFISANVNLSDVQPVELNVTLIEKNFSFYSNNRTGLLKNPAQSDAISAFRSEIADSLNATTLANVVDTAGKYEYLTFDDKTGDYIEQLVRPFAEAKIRNNTLNDEGFNVLRVYYDDASAIPPGSTNQKKPYYFAIRLPANPNNSKFTADQIVSGAKKALATKKLNVYKLEQTTYTTNTGAIISLISGKDKFNDVIVTGNFDPVIPDGTNSEIVFQFVTNNTAFISKLLPKPVPQQPISAATQSGASTNTDATQNEASETQKDESNKFASALHAMLNIVKSEVQNDGLRKSSKDSSYDVDILELTEKMYLDGVLSGVTREPQVDSTKPDGEPFDLLKYAAKGFNSNLMMDARLYNATPFVDYKELCKAYAIRYQTKNGNNFNFPIYIKFGYLLSFLNSMCLIYDSKQDTGKHPFVYLDFNPDTNFCLSIPQHLSIDPFTCLIPYNGSEEQYLSLYSEGIVDAVKEGTVLGPKQNRISSYLPKFKIVDNNYQGKTMEILLNIDFLIDTLKSYTANDETNAIYLKGFLDAIVVGINKSLGNINLFRVSYRDESNTVVIKDDQFVPGIDGKDITMLIRENFIKGINGKAPKYGTLPVFGQKSLVRQMEFATNTSTNMSKQIAISAQASTGAVNSTDHSSFSYLNVNYVDVYKPRVSDSSSTTSTQSANTSTKTKDNDIAQAQKFNLHVLSIYYGGEYLVKDRVAFATNYYINSMAKTKSEDIITKSAPFIPANISLTLDGVSGIIMGNAFTIPEDRLPLSLRGSQGQTKVGFIVSGLTHTIESNQWLTKIKGQMIRLRDSATYTGVTPSTSGSLEQIANTTATVAADQPYPGACAPDPSRNFAGYEKAAIQVLAPQSVNNANFSTYNPTYKFTPGKSNINLAKVGLTPLTKNDIVDDTTQNRFNIGTTTATPSFFIIHHTGGYDKIAEDTYATFYCTGLSAQYVIDRRGVIHQFMPNGALAFHAGNRAINRTSIGVEIMARTDNDKTAPVLDIQVKAAARLAQYLGFSINQVRGHGEVSGKKLADEGKKVVDFIKTLV